MSSIMAKNTAMHTALQNLSALVDTCDLIENVLSEDLYQAIEQLILQQESRLLPHVLWQTIRWDVCAYFEYKEIWFAPVAWSKAPIKTKHLNIDQCYAYFKLTIQNHAKEQIHFDDHFENNGNRLPTVNFFNHSNGFISIQFHLNKEILRNSINKELQYSACKKWRKSRNQLLQQYAALAQMGFQLAETLDYWYLPVDVLDPILVAQDFDNNDFGRSLDPVRNALKKLYPALEIFDLIQKQAKLLI